MKTIFKFFILISLAWVLQLATFHGFADGTSGPVPILLQGTNTTSTSEQLQFLVQGPVGFTNCFSLFRNTNYVGTYCGSASLLIPLASSNGVSITTTNCFADWAWPPTVNTNLIQSSNEITINLLPPPARLPKLLIQPTNSPSANYVLILSNGIANYTWQVVYTNRLGGTTGWFNLTQTPTVITDSATPVSIPIEVPDSSDPGASNRFYVAVWVTCPSQ